MAELRFDLNQKGATVAELLVTMSILALLSTIVFGLVSIGFRGWTDSIHSTEAKRNAIFATNQLVRDLRRSSLIDPDLPVIEVASPNEIVFYLEVDSPRGPLRVHYFLRNGQLIKGAKRPNNPNPPWQYTGPQTESVVATSIRNNDSLPLFRYIDGNGKEFTPTGQAGRKLIRVVRILLITDLDPARRPSAFRLESEARLRNQR